MICDYTIRQPWLLLPIRKGNDGPKYRLSDPATGTLLRHFNADLCEGTPDFLAAYDVRQLVGRTVHLEGERLELFLTAVKQSAEPPPSHSIYRPTVHYTARRGWLNDPNGLCFFQGTYHMFYQYNPLSLVWHQGMCWGHAVSDDLLHWRELEPALFPDQNGSCFSGTAWVDNECRSGFGNPACPAILLFYTACGKNAPEPVLFQQYLAVSEDGGKHFFRPWAEPLLPHCFGENRDPKVWFDAERDCWRMLLYLGIVDGKHEYRFYRSDNLRSWTEGDVFRCDGSGECPELLELGLEQEAERRYHVFVTAWGYYWIGRLDECGFVAESPCESLLGWRHYGTAYAPQSFANLADRQVMLFWLNGDYPGRIFNQSMGIPLETALIQRGGRMKLRVSPVRELESLRDGEFRYPEQGWEDLYRLRGQAFDIQVEFSGRRLCSLWLRGMECVYDPERGEVRFDGAAFQATEPGQPCKLRLLVDQGSVEIFACDGTVYFAKRAIFAPEFDYLTCFGSPEGLTRLEVFRLRNVGTA